MPTTHPATTNSPSASPSHPPSCLPLAGRLLSGRFLADPWVHHVPRVGETGFASRANLFPFPLPMDAMMSATDLVTSATLSMALAIESLTLVCHLTRLQSQGPFTSANESIASAIDSLPLASQLTSLVSLTMSSNL
jgi:hypothetical protein